MLSKRTKRSLLVVATLAALASGCSKGLDPAAVKTLAVMPFEDLTSQKDFGDLADGVTEHLAVTLGTAKEPRVIAATSSFEYKVRLRNLPEIRERLHADALLEGSVDIKGETITINTWLLDVANGKKVWEKNVSGKREATFVLTEEIATDLAGWLKKPLHFKKSIPAPTWQHFLFLLEGRRFLTHTDPVDVNLAVYDLEKLRGDYIDFWPARAPSAELFGRLVALEFLTRDKAREWVNGIVYDTRQQEPDSAEAYYADGALKYYVDWDWVAGETALKKAIDTRANLMGAWHALADLYVTTNRLPLALQTIEKAREIDPLGYETTRYWAMMLGANGRWDDALKAIDQAAELTKDERTIALLRGQMLYAKGDFEAARIAVAAMAEDTTAEVVAARSLYGAIAAKMGKPAETRRMIELVESQPKRKVAVGDPIHFALLHLSLGDAAKGYAELDSAVAAHRTLALTMAGSPAFAYQRSDPRFQAVLAKIAATRPIAPAASTPSANQ